MSAPESADQRLGEYFDALERAALDSPGETSPEQRRAAAHGGLPAGQLAAYLDKVHRHAFRVSDEDVEALCHNGFSEDAIFELTVAASVGAGLHRFRRGVAAMDASEAGQ